MSSPISLRNIPPHALQLAHHLCEQTGLSLADLLRQAIVTGLLVEATRFAPDLDGTFGGVEAEYLTKALRRHLCSAIDLLLEYKQHPYQEMIGQGRISQDEHHRTFTDTERAIPFQHGEGPDKLFANAIGDDLAMLGIGMSFTEVPEK